MRRSGQRIDLNGDNVFDATAVDTDDDGPTDVIVVDDDDGTPEEPSATEPAESMEMEWPMS